MRRDVVIVISVMLALNLFLVAAILASPETVIDVDPALIQDNQIEPGAPIMNSYPSSHDASAAVTDPTYAYDQDVSTHAIVSPQPGTSTSFYYFTVQIFNSSLTKEYIALDINMNYSVEAYRGQHKILLYVGSAYINLQLATNVNVTTPTLRTWTAVTEPNDGLWNQTDINNMKLRVEVRRTSGTTGWCTFNEYEASASIPIDSFNVRINISEVTQLVNWQFNLTFNPTVLQAVAISEGPFLKQVYSTFFTTVIDNTAGWAQAAALLKSYNYGGADGSGVLATVCFKSVAKGNSILNFSALETYLLKWEGGTLVDIPCEKHYGYFQYLMGDVSGDALVNVTDLYQLGEAYGTTSGSPSYNVDADQDKDGDVNGNDLAIVSNNYGAT